LPYGYKRRAAPLRLNVVAHYSRALTDLDVHPTGQPFNIDGYRTLRFPAWLVRKDPEYVARQILRALRRSGCPC
jgi:very-short-patch-repair endonuclease